MKIKATEENIIFTWKNRNEEEYDDIICCIPDGCKFEELDYYHKLIVRGNIDQIKLFKSKLNNVLFFNTKKYLAMLN